MSVTVRLDELLSKKIKDKQSKQAKEVIDLMLSYYSETQDKLKVANYLMGSNPAICLGFFELAIQSLDPESQIQSIYSAIRSTDSYKDNKNHAATVRGFIISAVMIKNSIPIARGILVQTLADIEKNGSFSEAVVNHFKRNVLDYCGSLEPIKLLGEEPWYDKESKNRFIRFMHKVYSSIVTIITPPKTKEFEVSQPIQNTSTSPLLNTPEVVEHSVAVHENDAVLGIAKELKNILCSASKEATLLTQSLSDTNGTISALRKGILDRDSQIKQLSLTISEGNQTIANLQHMIEENQQTLLEKESRIDDLSEQLKDSLNMGRISNNQDMITLKANLQNSLKVEYADYLIGKESECNPINYGALIDSLTRVFKTMRRYDIIIDS